MPNLKLLLRIDITSEIERFNAHLNLADNNQMNFISEIFGKSKYGMVTMCVGTGQGTVGIFECLN